MSILKSTNTGRASFEVDLGLSVHWCFCNVGATKPEEAGLYFAWGDTMGYKESEIKKGMFNKEWYKTLPSSKINTNLDLQHDAAHEYLKGKWRMPSTEEFQELKANTKQTVEVLNGIKGLRFTSENCNSIFIPFAGYADYGSVMRYGNEFDCWSSTFNEINYAYSIVGNSNGSAGEGCFYNVLGFSIRAVCDK